MSFTCSLAQPVRKLFNNTSSLLGSILPFYVACSNKSTPAFRFMQQLTAWGSGDRCSLTPPDMRVLQPFGYSAASCWHIRHNAFRIRCVI